jgi:hypothetical protein
MEWAYDGGKRKKWGILMQFSQGCECLGQGGDVKWEEFHYLYAYLGNETPKTPFILQKDGYSIG